MRVQDVPSACMSRLTVHFLGGKNTRLPVDSRVIDSSANHGLSILLKPFNGLFTIIKATLETIIIKVSFITGKKEIKSKSDESKKKKRNKKKEIKKKKVKKRK